MERPAVRLREAELSDALALSRLYAAVASAAAAPADEVERKGTETVRISPSEAQMRAWLTTCGVLLVEDAAGQPRAAASYSSTPAGRYVDRMATLPAARAHG